MMPTAQASAQRIRCAESERADFVHLCCIAAQTVSGLPSKTAEISSDQIIGARRVKPKPLKIRQVQFAPGLAWSLKEGDRGNRSQAIARRRPPMGFDISNAAAADRFDGPWERLVVW